MQSQYLSALVIKLGSSCGSNPLPFTSAFHQDSKLVMQSQWALSFCVVINNNYAAYNLGPVISPLQTLTNLFFQHL